MSFPRLTRESVLHGVVQIVGSSPTMTLNNKSLNYKFYFLLNEGGGCYEEGRKNQDVYIEKSGVYYGCGDRAFSDFFCAVNYLKNKTDRTVFFMTGFFVSSVKGFEAEGRKN